MESGSERLGSELGLRQVRRREMVFAMESLADADAWLEGWWLAWPLARKLAMEVQVDAELFARPWAEVWTQAEAEAHAKPPVLMPRKPWAGIEEQVEARALALAWKLTQKLQAEMWSQLSEMAMTMEPQGEAVARWEAEEEALALAGVWGWVQGEAQAQDKRIPSVLADSSTIRRILTTLNRYGAPQDKWLGTRDECSRIIHVITPIARLPFNLLRQIFRIIIDETRGPPLVLLIVCKHWHDIVTSIWASFNLRTRTPIGAVASKLEGNQWLDIMVDTESDRSDIISSEGAFEAIFAAIEVHSRWRSLVVKSLPAQADLSEDVVKRHLQRCSNTTMTRFTTFKIKSACETSPLLNGLLHILGMTASSELTTVEINSPNVISFLASTYPSIFHSVKVLSLDTPRMPNPVNLLPHLHQLESLTASHISFPKYHSNVHLPFTHTLCHLSLRAVPIQWMSDRTFHVLEYCTLIFPIHRRVLRTFRTTLPNCKRLTFQGSPLNILHNISAQKLTRLSVTCSGSFNQRGDRQLVQLSQSHLIQLFTASRLVPKILHISIEANSQAWNIALLSMTSLEELVIHSPRPSSLGANVFQALVAPPVNSTNSGAPPTPGPPGTLVCPLLQRFGLRYDRWLRRSEQFDLIPVFMSIIRSRQHLNRSLESFRLWMRSDQKDPLELVLRSGVNANAFKGLANESGIEEYLLKFTIRELKRGLHAARRPR